MLSVIKNTAKAAVFISGLAGMLALSSYVLTPKDNTEEAGMYDALANGILAEPDDTIDVLIVGDSEVYASIMPVEMWKDYGITSYCCGTGAQKLGYTYEFISKSFEKQSPELVFMETNAIYRELDYDDVLFNKAEGLFPFFAYHSRWKSVTARDLDPAVNYTNISATKGYDPCTDIKPADDSGYMAPSDEKEPVAPINRLYVEKMKKLCGSNGAQLILFSTPSTVNWTSQKHNSIQEIADELGLEYVDMNMLREDIAIDWQTDTRDGGDHMNDTGAKKVTSYLGRYISENYTLPAHKDDAVREQWDKAAESR